MSLYEDRENVMMGEENRPLLTEKTSSNVLCSLSGVAVTLVIFFMLAAAISMSTLTYTSQRNLLAQQEQQNRESQSCSGSSYSVNYKPFYGGIPSEDRFSVPPSSALIKNATIWTVDGTDTELIGYDILVEDGIIKTIGKNISVPGGFQGDIFDVQGAYVTPGLVDLHSHAGVGGFPADAFGFSDTNEATSPTTQFVRAVDGLNPEDPGIPLILSGGVTTSLVLPGSANVMGGEIAYIKLRGNTTKKLLIPNSPRALKMACGENPKRVYGGRGQLPSTRMGIGWKFRQTFYNAADLFARQNQWDCTQGTGSSIRPADLELQPLVDVLSGKVKLMIHCYTVEDLEMVIRTSDEFGFNISTFHHAMEAWKLADILSEKNISVATFATQWGFKMEAYDGSYYGGDILLKKGVNLIYKSDHPVLYAKFLLFEAAKAKHFNLNWKQAIRSVTMAPAIAAGISSRVGSIESDKDGDIVVWDRYPLDLGARPVKIYIEGNVVFSQNVPFVPPEPENTGIFIPSGSTACNSPISDVYAIIGVTVYTGVIGSQPIINATVVVNSSGHITCLKQFPDCQIPDSNIYDASGGILISGLVITGTSTGLMEVDQESATSDGSTSATVGAAVKVLDGIRINNYKNRHLTNAWKGGVTSTLIHPLGSKLVPGQAAMIHTHNSGILTVDDVLISDSVGVFVNIGDSAKSDLGSISAEIARLRGLLSSASNATNSSEDMAPFVRVLNKEIPLIVYVDQVDQIASVLRLKQRFNFDLVLYGATEAHLLADKLAQNSVSVILIEPRRPPDTFETYHASEDSVITLTNKGVRVGVGLRTPEDAPFVRWELGYLLARGLTFEQVLAAGSRNFAEIFHLENSIGTVGEGRFADFVVYDGNPFSLKSHVKFIANRNRIECSPDFYPVTPNK